jgi:hypothetical protein
MSGWEISFGRNFWRTTPKYIETNADGVLVYAGFRAYELEGDT